MSPAAFRAALLRLGLTPRGAAKLLSVSTKTVARWSAGDILVPGPVEQTLIAWMRLHKHRIPWRPDHLPIHVMTQEEIDEARRLMREDAVTLDAILEKVRLRGGPAAPWRVDLERHEAELSGVMFVHFYALPNGGFVPSSYRREDKEADYERDRPLIEDAIACIALEIARTGGDWVIPKSGDAADLLAAAYSLA